MSHIRVAQRREKRTSSRVLGGPLLDDLESLSKQLQRELTRKTRSDSPRVGSRLDHGRLAPSIDFDVPLDDGGLDVVLDGTSLAPAVDLDLALNRRSLAPSFDLYLRRAFGEVGIHVLRGERDGARGEDEGEEGAGEDDHRDGPAGEWSGRRAGQPIILRQ